MKLSLKLVLLFSLGLLIPGLSVAEFSPYVGADVQWKGIALKGLNHSAVAKRAPGVNVYGGLQLSELLGVEVGANVAKRHTIGTSTKLKGLHAAVVGNYPIACLADKQLSALGSAGVSHVRYAHKGNHIRLDYKKLRPRVLLGVDYALSPSLSWRTLGSWEGSFSKKPVNYNPKQALAASIGASTGLMVKF